MRPLEELRPRETAHRIVRGLTPAHFDATLSGDGQARAFLDAASEGASREPRSAKGYDVVAGW